MAVILITGADGQLGNELRVVSKSFYGYDFIFTDLDTLDISNYEMLSEFIGKTNPDWVINCAAYTQVDKAESDPEGANLINGTAVKNISGIIHGTDCRFIHISTDYVFDGKSSVPYNENSIVNPASAYGRSKLAGEKYALLHNGSMVIRTSWLYSSFGNNFVKTILKAARDKDSIGVVFDQTGSPTYAADLASAIMFIVSGVIRNHFALNAGIYNYANEGACTWYDLATEIVTEAGLSCRVNPILTRDYPKPAARPEYSVLDKTKIKETYGLSIPHWRSSLKQCLKLLT